MENIEKLLEGAESYVPIAKKLEFVSFCAERCFDKLNITANGMGDEINALPPMWKENTELKARYIMGALLKLYLRQTPKTEEGDEWLITAEEYDKWGQTHILNQIERMKSNAALRDKCFDLLQDYKTLEKMLNTEVYGLMNVMNDPISRAIAQVQASTSPESVQNMAKMFEESKKEYDKFLQESGKANKQE